MTRRDIAWRCVGAGGLVVATVLGIGTQGETRTLLGLPAFCLALIGLVLAVQGSRVPAALRVERSPHRALAQAIRDRRRRRGDGGTS